MVGHFRFMKIPPGRAIPPNNLLINRSDPLKTVRICDMLYFYEMFKIHHQSTYGTKWYKDTGDIEPINTLD